MAVGYDRIARDIAFTLEIKSPKIFENIFLNNGVLALIGAKGRVNLKRGGNRFDERVHLGQNTNVDHRSKFAPIPTNFQNNFKTAYYGQATCSGAVPLNMVEGDQNAGSERISSLTDAMVEELLNTFPNKVSDAILQATSGENDPVSLIEELPATAFGAQTRTTGGIARGDYPGTTSRVSAWQTQYSNTGADLSGATGIATAEAFVRSCGEGSAMNLRPDIMLTTDGVLSQASAAADVLRRFGVNDTLVKYGFDNIKIGSAALITDRNISANNALFLNTNFLRIQVLVGERMRRSGNVAVVGDGAVNVPLNVRPPIESDEYLNWVIKAYMTYNLTFGSLKYHGRMDNLTEAT